MAHMRQAVPFDAALLGPRLRQADKDECAAGSGLDPREAISRGIKYGEATTMCDDDGPFGIFGVVPHASLKGVGVCWMVSTERIHKHAHQFLRMNREVFTKIHRRYPILTNFVDARNAVHIKWLRWMNFSFINLHPTYGVQKRPFYEIVRIEHV